MIIGHMNSTELLIFRNMIPTCKMAIDIPFEYGSTEKYQGTLGHKVNHKFDPNTMYLPMESAR